MVILIKSDTDEKELLALKNRLAENNITVHESIGPNNSLLVLLGDTSSIDINMLESLNFVEKVKRIQEPYKKASRKTHPADTVISVGNTKIGGGNLTIIAGPCSVESEEQVCNIAKAVAKAGATILRGGTFKPRSSPYAFQGLKAEGIKYLLKARELTGLPIVTEIMDISQLPLFDDVDIIQVGARNMQNFELLKKLGSSKKPILLKRALCATYEDMLLSAEYIMANGNENVILCERGIRTFENYTRTTMDISAIPVLKKLSHLPVLADPSHASGMSELVGPLSKSAVACGADGLIIEVHNDPEHALSDGLQSIKPKDFEILTKQLFDIHKVI